MIRLHALKLSKRNMTIDKAKIKVMSILVLLSVLVYVLCLSLFSYYTRSNLFALTCCYGDEAKETENPIFISGVIVPVLTLTVLLLYICQRLKRLIETSIQPMVQTISATIDNQLHQSTNNTLTISIQATRMSSFYIICGYGLSLISAWPGIPKVMTMQLIGISATILNVIRIPMTIMMIFKHKKRQEQEEQLANNREERRLKEIAHAWRTRQRSTATGQQHNL